MLEFHKFNKQEQENALQELIYSRVLKIFFSQTSELSRHLNTLCFETLNQVVSLVQEDNLVSEDSTIQLNFINRFIKKTPYLKIATESLINFRSALSDACLNYTSFIKSENGMTAFDFYTENVSPLLEELRDNHPEKLICLLNSLNYNLIKDEGTKSRQTRFYKLFFDKCDTKILNQQVDAMRSEIEEANAFISSIVGDLLAFADSVNSVFLIDELRRIASQVFNECLIEFYKYDDHFNAEIDFNQCLFADSRWSDDDHTEISLNGKRFLQLEELPVQIERTDEQELTIYLLADLLEPHLEKQFFDELEVAYNNLLWKYPSLKMSLTRMDQQITLGLSKSKLALDEDLSLEPTFLIDEYYDFSDDEQTPVSSSSFAFIGNQFNEQQWFKVELSHDLVKKFNGTYVDNTTQQISSLITELENPLVSLEHNKFNTLNYNVVVKASVPFRYLSFGLIREDFDYLHRYADLLDTNSEFDYCTFYKRINYQIPGIVLNSEELQKLFTITKPIELVIGQGLESFWIKHYTDSALKKRKNFVIAPISKNQHLRDNLAKRFQKCFENGLEKINSLLLKATEDKNYARYPLKMTCAIGEDSTKNKLQLLISINLKIDSNIDLERVIKVTEDGKVLLNEVKDFLY